MQIFAKIMVSVVALLHFAFMALEMFFWDHPIGQKLFAMTAEQSAQTAVVAANQGLYNGLFAVGLLWGLLYNKRDVMFYLLVSIIIAGVFGAATAKASIIFSQSLPAVIAMLALYTANRKPTDQSDDK